MLFFAGIILHVLGMKASCHDWHSWKRLKPTTPLSNIRQNIREPCHIPFWDPGLTSHPEEANLQTGAWTALLCSYYKLLPYPLVQKQQGRAPGHILQDLRQMLG